MQEIQIVGGGLAGLAAAITVAEAGHRATVFESSPAPGGRARTLGERHRTNFGGHALYFGGPMEAWLRRRDLLPPSTPPKSTAVRVVWKGRLRRLPTMLVPMLRSLRHDAPVDEDYGTFAKRHMSARAAQAAAGFASLPTFHPAPEDLSAAFVQERLRRTLARPAVGYVTGGWQTLVDGLVRRAESLGVGFRTGEKRASLPGAPGCPQIVATDLPAARKLLDDESLDWPRARHALFDVSLRRARRDPLAILDLDQRVYVSDYAAYDASLAPPGESLIQCVAGLHDGESLRDGLARIHALLDRGYRDWKGRVCFERKSLMDGGTGAVDLPGTAWQDRPAIDRGEGVFLAGDRVAAPGLLSEVSVVSGVRAAAAALGVEPEI